MLKMDFDGNIRMYSLKEDGETWVVSWQAFHQPCMVHGCCGPNSICIYIPKFGRKCSCIPGYKMKYHTDWSLGCEPEFHLSCNQTKVGFLKLRHVDFYGYDYSLFTNITLEGCKKICSQLCDCKDFLFRFSKESDGTYCYPKTQLMNGHRPPGFNTDFYEKCPRLLSPFTLTLFKIPSYNVPTKTHDNSSPKAGYLLATTGFRKFTYAELKKATNSFSEENGRGGGGIVYKVILSDGRVAAIKRLIDANQGEAEFLAEVNTIGKLNHMNLIDMWGYCAEGKRRFWSSSTWNMDP
ncbi:hypothetical protein CRYUN_Cryun28dG0077900 [Craigia yunnanensis]